MCSVCKLFFMSFSVLIKWKMLLQSASDQSLVKTKNCSKFQGVPLTETRTRPKGHVRPFLSQRRETKLNGSFFLQPLSAVVCDVVGRPRPVWSLAAAAVT